MSSHADLIIIDGTINMIEMHFVFPRYIISRQRKVVEVSKSYVTQMARFRNAGRHMHGTACDCDRDYSQSEPAIMQRIGTDSWGVHRETVTSTFAVLPAGFASKVFVESDLCGLGWRFTIAGKTKTADLHAVNLSSHFLVDSSTSRPLDPTL